MKIYKSAKKREKAYVLLESIVILSVVACICMFLNKVVANNYLKSSIIYTKDDIKTLSVFEESILLDAMERFSNGEQQPFINTGLIGEVKETIVSISGVDGMLTKKKGSNRESYIDLKCENINVDGKEVIKLVPKLYKTDYIVK